MVYKFSVASACTRIRPTIVFLNTCAVAAHKSETNNGFPTSVAQAVVPKVLLLLTAASVIPPDGMSNRILGVWCLITLDPKRKLLPSHSAMSWLLSHVVVLRRWLRSGITSWHSQGATRHAVGLHWRHWSKACGTRLHWLRSRSCRHTYSRTFHPCRNSSTAWATPSH